MRSASQSSIRIDILRQVVADRTSPFATKDVSEDPRMRRGHPELVAHRHYHSFVGGALSDHHVALGITEVRRSTSRGSVWQTTPETITIPQAVWRTPPTPQQEPDRARHGEEDPGRGGQNKTAKRGRGRSRVTRGKEGAPSPREIATQKVARRAERRSGTAQVEPLILHSCNGIRIDNPARKRACQVCGAIQDPLFRFERSTRGPVTLCGVCEDAARAGSSPEDALNHIVRHRMKRT